MKIETDGTYLVAQIVEGLRAFLMDLFAPVGPPHVDRILQQNNVSRRGLKKCGPNGKQTEWALSARHHAMAPMKPVRGTRHRRQAR